MTMPPGPTLNPLLNSRPSKITWRSIRAGFECYVDGERVRTQAGGFYGGWITAEIVGPFKGEPGTSGW